MSVLKKLAKEHKLTKAEVAGLKGNEKDECFFNLLFAEREKPEVALSDEDANELQELMNLVKKFQQQFHRNPLTGREVAEPAKETEKPAEEDEENEFELGSLEEGAEGAPQAEPKGETSAGGASSAAAGSGQSGPANTKQAAPPKEPAPDPKIAALFQKAEGEGATPSTRAAKTAGLPETGRAPNVTGKDQEKMTSVGEMASKAVPEGDFTVTQSAKEIKFEDLAKAKAPAMQKGSLKVNEFDPEATPVAPASPTAEDAEKKKADREKKLESAKATMAAALAKAKKP